MTVTFKKDSDTEVMEPTPTTARETPRRKSRMLTRANGKTT